MRPHKSVHKAKSSDMHGGTLECWVGNGGVPTNVEALGKEMNVESGNLSVS
jgi:hypothetical protein